MPYYPWPASALSADDMRMLHGVREGHPRRVPITQLIAEAVRQTYGATTANQEETHEDHTPASRAA